MNWKKIVGLLFVFGVAIYMIVTAGCSFPLDTYESTVVKGDIKDIIGEMVVVTTKAKFRMNKNTDWLDETRTATAFNIGNGYIVALTHATHVPKERVMRMGPFIAVVSIEVKDEKYFIGEKEVSLVGRFEDISVFTGGRQHSCIRWGDSDKLDYGTKVVVLGNSLMRGLNLKTGEVSAPNLIVGNYFEYDSVSFLTSAPINPGDSGSPVFARNAFGYELIGIACAKMMNVEGMGFVYKSNYVKKAIKEVLDDAKKGGDRKG